MDIQTTFLVSLGAALVTLVGAIGKARVNWRDDIPAFGRATRITDVLLHPERYTDTRAVPTVRALALAGSLFLVVAVAALGCQLVLEVP